MRRFWVRLSDRERVSGGRHHPLSLRLLRGEHPRLNREVWNLRRRRRGLDRELRSLQRGRWFLEGERIGNRSRGKSLVPAERERLGKRRDCRRYLGLHELRRCCSTLRWVRVTQRTRGELDPVLRHRRWRLDLRRELVEPRRAEVQRRHAFGDALIVETTCLAGHRDRGHRLCSPEEILNHVDQLSGLERLRHDGVASGRQRAIAVERFEGAGEEHHRDMQRVRVALERLANLVAVDVRHHDVAQHHVGLDLRQAREQVATAPDSDHLVLGFGEGELNNLLNRDAVIGQQKGPTHGHLASALFSRPWYHEQDELSTTWRVLPASTTGFPSSPIHTTAPVSSHPGTTRASRCPCSNTHGR